MCNKELVFKLNQRVIKDKELFVVVGVKCCNVYDIVKSTALTKYRKGHREEEIIDGKIFIGGDLVGYTNIFPSELEY